MNNKNKKVNKTQKSNFLYFPNKLNILTIFLIFVIYGALLFVAASVVFPKPNYVIALNYEPNTYNEEINPFVLIRGTAEKDNEDPSILNNSTRMFVYIQPMNNSKITRATYAYSALDSGGFMRYFIESPRTGYNVPVTHNSSKTIIPTNNDLDKLFIKVRYKININEEIQTKELRFSEDVLHLTKRDTSSSDFSLGNTIDGLVSVHFEAKDNPADPKQYETNFEIVLADKNKPHHINFQSWIVTKDGQIFPYLGLYNYSHNANFKPSYYTYVNKYIQPYYIYSKLVYTNPVTNEVTELLYKVNFEALTK